MLKVARSLVAQTIAYNLGNIQIDRYVRVSTGAFREIVDLVWRH